MNFIFAPLIISAISSVLAALIYITDLIANNYGEVNISINNGKKDLLVKGGSPLLATLANEKVFLPSACGGKGTCGACKVKTLSDVGPVMPTEIPYLSPAELNDSIRLACQVKLKKDISIQIPEELFNIQQYRARVEKINDVTHDIKEVHLALPESMTISFKTGQYVQFEVPPYRKIKTPTFRAYSMASEPAENNKVELLIRLVPGGIVTTYVHEVLQEGQEINVTGPFGDFYVRDTDATMICVAGGSGMAPFKSIFKNMITTGTINDRVIWYFFGAKTSIDMYYLDWLYALDEKYPNFHFVAALSEPEEGTKWRGATGLITEVMDQYFQASINKDFPLEGYLCGSPGMLDACMDVMKKNNMQEDKIYFDKF